MLHYETIVPEARLLLEKLSDLHVLKDARLVGGTALALQLGHRTSVDLDFFGRISADSEELRSILRDVGHVEVASVSKNINNVSSTNYSTLYKRFRRTDVMISSKSPSFYVSPLLNSPLSRGELTYGFVPRILYSGSSLKFTSFFSSNSR